MREQQEDGRPEGIPRGDDAKAEFDAFYAATARRMVAAVYALTGSLSDAEDAVQEAYARAWIRWGRVTAGGDPAAWVRVVAQRMAVSSWRKARNRLLAHRRSERSDAVPELGPDHVALVAALQRLPKDQRRTVVLFHVYDLPAETVARELGCSTGAVRTRLHRARQALAELLADPAETEASSAPSATSFRTPGGVTS
ncbi:SigE family RNA polymerase sigma factor [Yinghuangia seranimata]|uniref:SigE family RNA polymerase sigma factor n=1 Tax=Yinghuangia seranimata TaxID=408067 RepID=UPI00248D2903|nr:SigE family RNA polymerase sigma factor [Yinghuangia seranimata]MDI2126101.1 SigE family RNA polymerase sigma factor [Yinghuangia seranimata]